MHAHQETVLCKFCRNPAICLRQQVIFMRSQKCPWPLSFDLDLEHTLDAHSPGDLEWANNGIGNVCQHLLQTVRQWSYSSLSQNINNAQEASTMEIFLLTAIMPYLLLSPQSTPDNIKAHDCCYTTNATLRVNVTYIIHDPAEDQITNGSRIFYFVTG